MSPRPLTEPGRRFRAALALRGLTIPAALAEAGDAMSPGQVSESCRREDPHLSTVRRLAEIAGTSIA